MPCRPCTCAPLQTARQEKQLKDKCFLSQAAGSHGRSMPDVTLHTCWCNVTPRIAGMHACTGRASAQSLQPPGALHTRGRAFHQGSCRGQTVSVRGFKGAQGLSEGPLRAFICEHKGREGQGALAYRGLSEDCMSHPAQAANHGGVTGGGHVVRCAFSPDWTSLTSLKIIACCFLLVCACRIWMIPDKR